MTAAGVDVRPLRQMNGDRHFSEVFLDQAVVADADRIGAVGEGWGVAITTLLHERGALVPAGIGPGRRQLLELAGARGAGDDPMLRQRVADVVAHLEVGRLTRDRARAAAEAGGRPGPEGSGAKLRGAQALKALADLALDRPVGYGRHVRS